MWKLLVLLHAVSAIALLGASTHHAVVAVLALRGRPRPRLARIYSLVVLVSFAVTFAFGASAYPRFRHLVRALYLDAYAMWASRLFEAKEDLAAMGLPLVGLSFILARATDAKVERISLVGYVVATVSVAAIVWFDLVCGLLITMTKAG